MADICTATVTVQYNKKDNKIGSVEIRDKEEFLKCVKGEVTSATASAVEQTDQSSPQDIEEGNITRGNVEGQTTRGGRRKKSRRRGKRSGRKSKRRSSKKARKSRKSKRRRGKKSKRRRRRK